jgi:hypothetical protein
MPESNILAIIAIVISAMALGWQAVSWHRSGPMVTVVASSCSGLLTVHAINSGRGPVTIMRLEVGRPTGWWTVITCFRHGSDQLPFRLEPGASGVWVKDGTETLEQYMDGHYLDYVLIDHWYGSGLRRHERPATSKFEQRRENGSGLRVRAILGNGRTVMCRPLTIEPQRGGRPGEGAAEDAKF